uniref:Uncharacterized protein n=1 Tax=Rhipicephalus appendiculatus TaxID=34631 RepID=A0A131YCE0_RHIAP
MWWINGHVARMLAGYRTRNRGFSCRMMTMTYDEHPRSHEVWVVPEGYVAEVSRVRNQHFAMKEHFAVCQVVRVRIDMLNDVCLRR